MFFGYALEFSVGVFVGLAISNCSRQLLHNNGNQHFIFLQQHRKSYIYIADTLPETNKTLENWCLGNDPFFLVCLCLFWELLLLVLGVLGVQIDFFSPTWASHPLRQITSDMLPPPYSGEVSSHMNV